MSSRSASARSIQHARTQAAAVRSASNASAFTQKQSHRALRAEMQSATARAQNAHESVPVARAAPSARPMPATRQSKFALSDDRAAVFGDSGLGKKSEVTYVNPVDVVPQSVKERRARFEAVVERSRQERVDRQVERAEEDKATEGVDADFDLISHLVQARTRREMEKAEFATSGTADVRALLAEHYANREEKRGRVLSIGSGDAVAKPIEDVGHVVPQRKRPQTPEPAPTPAPAAPAAREADAFDDFDRLMAQMGEGPRAIATERSATDVDVEMAQLQSQLTALDRERRQIDVKESKDLSRREYLAQGGEEVFRMTDADAVDAAVALPSAHKQLNTVDDCLAELEAACKKGTSAERASSYFKLRSATAAHPQMAMESFRLIMLDMHSRSVSGRPLTVFHALVMRCAATSFSAAERHHPVATPLLVLVSGLCCSSTLHTVTDCARALFLAHTLLDMLTPESGARFCGEPAVIALNVIGTLLPHSALAPKGRHQRVGVAFPLLDRASAPVLAGAGLEASPKPLSVAAMFSNGDGATAADVLTAAYSLVHMICGAQLLDSASLPSVLGEFLTLAEAITEAKCFANAPKLLREHNRIVEEVRAALERVVQTRAPLAMRTFRPRPLRQYEPMLIDDASDEMKQRRVMKQELRENTKRVVRSVQAEALVRRREREREDAAETAIRSEKYRSVMAELQQQQQIMKTVDSHRAKAKSKKKKSISGAPTGNDEGGADEE